MASATSIADSSRRGRNSMKIQAMLAIAALCVLPTAVQAQARPAPAEKKLYCWNENGRKVCGDALPADAVDAARTELSASSGRPRARLGEQLTPQERAIAEDRAHQGRIAAKAEGARLRRERAVADSYETQEDPRRALGAPLVR